MKKENKKTERIKCSKCNKKFNKEDKEKLNLHESRHGGGY